MTSIHWSDMTDLRCQIDTSEPLEKQYFARSTEAGRLSHETTYKHTKNETIRKALHTCTSQCSYTTRTKTKTYLCGAVKTTDKTPSF